MTKSEATAEIFLTALKALSQKERNAVIARIARDKAFREDLLDLALIDKRRRESSRPLREYLAKKAK